jgi:hypothetical protein
MSLEYLPISARPLEVSWREKLPHCLIVSASDEPKPPKGAREALTVPIASIAQFALRLVQAGNAA